MTTTLEQTVSVVPTTVRLPPVEWAKLGIAIVAPAAACLLWVSTIRADTNVNTRDIAELRAGRGSDTAILISIVTQVAELKGKIDAQAQAAADKGQ